MIFKTTLFETTHAKTNHIANEQSETAHTCIAHCLICVCNCYRMCTKYSYIQLTNAPNTFAHRKYGESSFMQWSYLATTLSYSSCRHKGRTMASKVRY